MQISLQLKKLEDSCKGFLDDSRINVPNFLQKNPREVLFFEFNRKNNEFENGGKCRYFHF